VSWLPISGPATFTVQVFPSAVACNFAAISDLCGFTVYTDVASVSEIFLRSFNGPTGPCSLNNIVIVSSQTAQADWVTNCNAAGPLSPCFILTGASMPYYDVCSLTTGTGLDCDNAKLFLESPYPTGLAFRNATVIGRPLINIVTEAYANMVLDGLTVPNFVGGPLEINWFNTVPGLPVYTLSQFLVNGCVAKSSCGGNSCSSPTCASAYLSPPVACPAIT
jgi:hypothetical protein